MTNAMVVILTFFLSIFRLPQVSNFRLDFHQSSIMYPSMDGKKNHFCYSDPGRMLCTSHNQTKRSYIPKNAPCLVNNDLFFCEVSISLILLLKKRHPRKLIIERSVYYE